MSEQVIKSAKGRKSVKLTLTDDQAHVLAALLEADIASANFPESMRHERAILAKLKKARQQ